MLKVEGVFVDAPVPIGVTAVLLLDVRCCTCLHACRNLSHLIRQFSVGKERVIKNRPPFVVAIIIFQNWCPPAALLIPWMTKGQRDSMLEVHVMEKRMGRRARVMSPVRPSPACSIVNLNRKKVVNYSIIRSYPSEKSG